MKRFALGILTGCVGLLGMVAASYGVLALVRPESLPAPTITRLSALDEKLRFLRHHPDYDPAMLAIGSSIAWRQLDGAAFDAIAGRSHAFLNGATVHLQMHQTRALLDFYLKQYDKVRTVLLLTGPPDFEDCSMAPAALMPAGTAAAYAFDNMPAAWFYMRFFAPQRFLRSAMTLAERREPLTGDLHIDRWGSGPLDVPDELKRGLRYGETAVDPACLDAIDRLAGDLRQRGVHLAVVFPPVHPDYRRQYPEAMNALCAVAARLKPHLDAGAATLTMRQNDPRYRDEDFFDAFHLQYPAVRRLSEDLALTLQGKVSDSLVASSSRSGLRDVARPARPDTAESSGCGKTG